MSFFPPRNNAGASFPARLSLRVGRVVMIRITSLSNSRWFMQTSEPSFDVPQVSGVPLQLIAMPRVHMIQVLRKSLDPWIVVRMWTSVLSRSDLYIAGSKLLLNCNVVSSKGSLCPRRVIALPSHGESWCTCHVQDGRYVQSSV